MVMVMGRGECYGRSSAWESESGRGGHERVFRKQGREREVEEIKKSVNRT